MRWEDREESSNVEDRRGLPAGGGIAIGGGLGTLVMLLLVVLLGGNPQDLMNQVGGQLDAGPAATEERRVDPQQEPLRKFVAVVLKDTEDVWAELFKEQLGKNYVEPKLVLFTDSVRSACGMAGSQVGPFYCPGDSNVYLDLASLRSCKSNWEQKVIWRWHMW